VLRLALVSLALLIFSAPAQADDAEALRGRVETALSEHPECVGMAVAVLDAGHVWGAAAGPADGGGRALTIDTPLRVASNTKTFVAATCLRLAARGDLDLDASLASLADPDLVAQLDEAGYATKRITVRQLLMHAAGLRNHADMDYVHAVLADPGHAWTRKEQVARMTTQGGPLGEPGEVYEYSDTDYILLGDILERLTKEPLAAVVREEIGYDRLGLHCTWWEDAEHAPEGSAKPASQYLQGFPVSTIDASADAHGGGGLMASASDLARFLDALFHDRVFDDPATLELMRTAPGHPDPENYRIGLTPMSFGGHDAIGHAGFWGTVAVYVPDLDVTIAAAVLDVQGVEAMNEVVAETIASLDD
jgi:D-alanyl-D-alanine carboxypeptidase